MPNTFKMDNIPFSLLNEGEKRLLSTHLDIAYYQQGETVIAAGDVPEGVYIILKGRVSESEASSENEAAQHIFVHYENEDYFGGWSALRGTAIHNFVAEEESICHILPTRTLLELMASNAQFADYFQQNLAVKREIVAQHGGNQDMAEFMLAKITDAAVRDPLVVEQGVSIREATELMRHKKADCVLARKGGRLGMVTGTDLLDAVVLEQRPLETDVSEIASYRLVTIDHEDYLFNALVMMTQQQIERVVVLSGQEMVGVVELTDVLSYFSSHSHVIGLRIERAASIDQLREAALGLNELIKALISTGVKIRFTMDLLAAMNGRIIAKLFDLTVPADMQPHVCLIVMGSEGRAEQIMKTDQDNALLFRDNLAWADKQATMERFSATLISFGFPPCPGNIMVSNPEWVNSVGDWTQKMSDWADTCEGNALMKLAIAVDAKPVAGNEALFKVARNWFLRHLRNNDVFFSHFARAAVEFDTPLTFFGNLKDRDRLDIKKGGIFPIVHGVRTLALEQRIIKTNTFQRIEQLIEQGVVREQHGRDLSEALALFIQLRLRQQIKRTEEADDGVDPTPNQIDLQQLNKLERDLLRDALHVVKGFKKHLAQRYHLGG
ncbi:putative nucleotidyltransferase substrate binding domain-containing protein [Marinobacterium marinum]|uniref:Cyclic nucleotide-binding/CBS domain-containing protein n=1 Tax=Marinobacterium marinum TaxID=2756129 RepID=A0A7W1WVM3_9GAMM|nr:putative nucleotidyltransferase substrate binding domain-containing protein [Marinobacterium marinum]MBA4501065.1 cyclic nucleotide-binding/CBS domain-containing protein [Marinobacterium marinum]